MLARDHAWMWYSVCQACMLTMQVDGGKAAPFILQLDLQMDAPVITMPRFSDSQDNVKVDLGAVRMSNAVAWHAGSSPNDPQVWLKRVEMCSAGPYMCADVSGLARQCPLQN